MGVSGKTAQTIVAVANMLTLGMTVISGIFANKANEQNKKDLVNIIDSRIDAKSQRK